VVNAGFSGLLWAPEVRHATSPADLIRRMQTALFSAQMLINAWYLKNPPWEQIDTDKNLADEPMEGAKALTRIAHALCETRARMLPYFREMFEKYRDEGRPVFRALVLDYPDEPETYGIDDAYMVGDRYLFAPLTAQSDTRRVYLPKGLWRRNGMQYAGGWHVFTCPLDEYLLFEKA
jgi:alpha-D-xyloside xylohydrolase